MSLFSSIYPSTQRTSGGTVQGNTRICQDDATNPIKLRALHSSLFSGQPRFHHLPNTRHPNNNQSTEYVLPFCGLSFYRSMPFAATPSLLLSRFIRPFSSTTSPILLSLTGSPSSAAAQSSFTMSNTQQTATLAAGCFWGVEHLFRKHFGNGKGLLDAKVGYSGGKTTAPSYRAVCSGDTGRASPSFFPQILDSTNRSFFPLFVYSDAEALQVTYDPSLVSYPQLLEFFFRMHDPTTMNRQGGDVGTQYRSAIFTHSDEQQKTAEGVAEKVAAQWYKQPLSTQIIPAGPWWDAEDYHQLYLHKNPSGYECPAQYVVLPSLSPSGQKLMVDGFVALCGIFRLLRID